MPVPSPNFGDPSQQATRNAVVLVVDDDRMIREVATRSLERAGYQVVAVGSGQEAVDLVRSQSHGIDAILLDLSMPEMDGWEAAAQLKACRPEIPIALTSGYGEDQFPARRGACNYDAFLDKPYGPGELALCVDSLLASGTRDDR
ncbi:MAG: response regulator [Myxococcota bacterium]